ncbi:succinate dehydrogenase, cytochrome b556 subunit [Chthonobacter rhizosphaerae]|uniref:succinate dehydrogenase, cytochrome b556 subunit n=1 Tax=Chthonobacter rhizosphaerae TaxID=2735553 RepID=UPI0015EEF4A6|nr:succinate dehydrogenase, cytochrome b556 subunit [Chthonobacter rhizosphaerae]
MAELQTKVARPLSPHLQIFRPLLTMVMSIVHRITGGALYAGTALLAWYLVAAASGPDAFATASWFFGSIIGQLILFGYTWVWIHHALGGIRHFIWDTGHGYGVEARNWLAKATLIGSVSVTILVWAIALIVR